LMQCWMKNKEQRQKNKDVTSLASLTS